MFGHQRRHLGDRGRQGIREFGFGAGIEQGGIDAIGDSELLFTGLAQDVADTLVRGREAFGFRLLGEHVDGADAAVEVAQAGRTHGEHGFEGIAPNALIGVVAAQAVDDEVIELFCMLADIQRNLVAPHRVFFGVVTLMNCVTQLVVIQRIENQRIQIEIESAFDQRACEAQSIAAQRERVLVAGRLLADREHAGQRVQLLGDGEHLAETARRDGIAGETRLVELVERIRDFGRFTLCCRVVATHDALQLREFADHARHQVALRELGGLRRLRRIDAEAVHRAQAFGDHARQFADAADLVPDRTEFLLVGDLLQRVLLRGERRLQVVIEEELGVGEARTDHAFITLADLVRITALDVGDADEMFGQLAVRIEHREELLVRLHRHDQRFLRHAQEVTLEGAGDADRPLDQVLHFVDQFLAQTRHAAAGLGHTLYFGDHAIRAFGRIDQHLRGTQRVDVVVGVADPHRLRMMEAVAATHAIGFQAEDLGRHDFATEQDHQPMRRAHELVVEVGPAHRLRDRQRLQRLLDDLRQQCRRRFTRLHGAMHEPRALVGIDLLQLLDSDAAAVRETDQGLGRRAAGIERGIRSRATAFEFLFGLLQGDVFDPDREPARRMQRPHRMRGVRDAALAQAGSNAIAERVREFIQRLRRQFFGAEFDQQRCNRIHRISLLLRD